MKSIAITQPYVFPYLGYYQLVKSVDKFIIYDDVNFITRGWVNRNQILVNKNSYKFTIPVKKTSQNKLICKTEIESNSKAIKKLQKTIELAYTKAPFFEEIYDLVVRVLNGTYESIGHMASQSLKEVCSYLEIPTVFAHSSEMGYDNSNLERAERLIDICKLEKIKIYINLPGGRSLYDKEYFMKRGIELKFIEPNDVVYNQYDNEFVKGLSIIDILMFNSREACINLLDNYNLD